MLLNICAWNVRGLNDSGKQKEVANFLRKEKINIVGLLETKMLKSHHVSILNHVLHNWESHINYDHATLGRIWVYWDPAFCTIDILDMSDQHIMCKVTVLDGNMTFLCCFVHAQNSY